MANQVPFVNTNFKSSDSPVIIDLLAALGTGSRRSVVLANTGPGRMLVSVSFDEGVTFETATSIRTDVKVSRSLLDGVDQIKIEHSGDDSGYVIVAAASNDPPQIDIFTPPEVYFANNMFDAFLLDGVTKNMAVNGSITPVEYSFTVAADTRVRVSNGVLNLEDGNQMFRPEDFAAINALPNGVEVSVTPSGGAKNVLQTWSTNRDIGDRLSLARNRFRTEGATSFFWDFKDDLGGAGLYLNEGDKFSFLIQDALQNVEVFTFNLVGTIRDV